MFRGPSVASIHSPSGGCCPFTRPRLPGAPASLCTKFSWNQASTFALSWRFDGPMSYIGVELFVCVALHIWECGFNKHETCLHHVGPFLANMLKHMRVGWLPPISGENVESRKETWTTSPEMGSCIFQKKSQTKKGTIEGNNFKLHARHDLQANWHTDSLWIYKSQFQISGKIVNVALQLVRSFPTSTFAFTSSTFRRPGRVQCDTAASRTVPGIKFWHPLSRYILKKWDTHRGRQGPLMLQFFWNLSTFIFRFPARKI